MNENHGAATKLLYQLFISLGRKAKKNLTGVAMETMRPSAPVKLEGIESAMHKEVVMHSLNCLITLHLGLVCIKDCGHILLYLLF